MNSQHYFKKLEKFAVCAFQAEKGCIEVELKSESCGIYHYVFYGSAKIGRPFQSEYNVVKKGDFFNMKDDKQLSKKIFAHFTNPKRLKKKIKNVNNHLSKFGTKRYITSYEKIFNKKNA